VAAREAIFEAYFTGQNGDFSFMSKVGSWEPGFIQLYDRTEPFTNWCRVPAIMNNPVKQTIITRAGAIMAMARSTGGGPMYRVWKWSGRDDTNLKQAETDDTEFPIYRLADVMLMRAEALNRASNGGNRDEVMKLVNAYGHGQKCRPKRLRATMFDIENIIMDERAIELSVEGKRWFDLMRASKGRPITW
jgi:hypothetical protein